MYEHSGMEVTTMILISGYFFLIRSAASRPLSPIAVQTSIRMRSGGRRMQYSSASPADSME